MVSNEELRKIKKKYGERFMHMCRELFPTILEEEGCLLSILEETFANNSRTLYEDIHNRKLEESFKKFILSKVEFEPQFDDITETRTPYELLDEAGYNLYECKNEADIHRFKKYFSSHEELCTFNGGRLSHCIVFFAVRKNVDEIKREDFKEPEREDEYGTSVMSIQFYKAGLSTVSIKNRYNHTVANPDATYGNDLDRIIPGLSKSFANLLMERGMTFSTRNISRLEIPGYIVAGDGKYYKYNLEKYGEYFCPGNIFISHGQVFKLQNPERQILVDYFIIDFENKTIKNYPILANGIRNAEIARLRNFDDSFPDTFNNEIEKMEVLRDKKRGERIIKIKKKNCNARIELRISRDNQLLEYINEELEGVRENFLRASIRLRSLILPNLKNVGDDFVANNKVLEYLELPKLRVAHNNFLRSNIALKAIDFPELVRVADLFLEENETIEQANFSKLQLAGNNFMARNRKLKRLEVPSLIQVKNNFLANNQILEYLFAPNLSIVYAFFLDENMQLEELELPSLVHAGEFFLRHNNKLKSLKINNPKVLKQIEDERILAGKKIFITPQMLARLDKHTKLTTFEIELITKFRRIKARRNKEKSK